MTNNEPPPKPIELQTRDIAVLADLRELTILSLDQIQRLHWPGSSREICRKRLSALMNHGEKWLQNFTVSKPEMVDAGLQPGQVYHLSEAGRAWFRQHERPPGKLPRPRQALHDLLISEWFVKLTELTRAREAELAWRGDWQIRFYRSPQAERATLVPDGLAILTGLAAQPLPLFLELDFSREAHGRLSSRIGRKVTGYDAYLKQWHQHSGLDGLEHFPAVLLLTHGEQRLDNLAAAVLQHRRGKVAYALALTEQVYQADDPLSAPLWRLIPANQRAVSQPRPLVDADWLASARANRRPPARLPTAVPPPPAPPPPPDPPALKPAAAPVPVPVASKKPAANPTPPVKAPTLKPLSETPILPAQVTLTRPGKLGGFARRLSARLTGAANTGCPWSDALLQQAADIGLSTQWQPLPEAAKTLFAQRHLPPPAGLLTLAGATMFTDRHFEQTPQQLQRLASYRELGYLWAEQRLPAAFPQWALLTLPDPARAKPFLEAAQPERRLISLILTTGLEFEQSPASLLDHIWRALPAHSTGSMSLVGRPLLTWTTG